MPPALPRKTRADPCCAAQLIDRNDTRRGIGAPRSKTLYIEAQASRRQCHAEKEALKLIVGQPYARTRPCQ